MLSVSLLFCFLVWHTAAQKNNNGKEPPTTSNTKPNTNSPKTQNALVISPQACLWPPNHKYVFMPNITRQDVIVKASCPLTRTFISCKSDQPDDDKADGKTFLDCIYSVTSDTLCVRSERQGTDKKGRHYTVTISVSGSCIQTQTVEWTIYVAHDMRLKKQDTSLNECWDPNHPVTAPAECAPFVTPPSPPPPPPACDYYSSACWVADADNGGTATVQNNTQDTLIIHDLPVNVVNVSSKLDPSRKKFIFTVVLDSEIEKGSEAWNVVMEQVANFFGIPSKDAAQYIDLTFTSGAKRQATEKGSRISANLKDNLAPKPATPGTTPVTPSPKSALTISPEACLWPPNHKYVFMNNITRQDVIVKATCPLTRTFLSCKSDQPDDDKADGKTFLDCIYSVADDTLCVRSERQGTVKKGRHYTVSILVSGDCIETQTVEWTIYVAHDMREKKNDTALSTCFDPNHPVAAPAVCAPFVVTPPPPPPPVDCDYYSSACWAADATTGGNTQVQNNTQDTLIVHDLPVDVVNVSSKLDPSRKKFTFTVVLSSTIDKGSEAWTVVMEQVANFFGIPAKDAAKFIDLTFTAKNGKNQSSESGTTVNAELKQTPDAPIPTKTTPKVTTPTPSTPTLQAITTVDPNEENSENSDSGEDGSNKTGLIVGVVVGVVVAVALIAAATVLYFKHQNGPENV